MKFSSTNNESQAISTTNYHAKFRLQLLGGFQLHHGDIEIRVTSRKARLLLAYLAQARSYKARRDTLAQLFWADAEIQQARSSLRQTLSGLRKNLAPYRLALWADQDCIGLNPNNWQIDINELIVAATDTTVSSMQTNTGTFLQGYVVSEAEIELWIEQQRHRFHELSLSLLSAQMQSCYQCREYHSAIQIGLTILVIDPYRESAHRSLMSIYEAHGDSARALRHYKLLRQRLDRDLNVPPELETVDLYNRIQHARRINVKDRLLDRTGNSEYQQPFQCVA